MQQRNDLLRFKFLGPKQILKVLPISITVQHLRHKNFADSCSDLGRCLGARKDIMHMGGYVRLWQLHHITYCVQRRWLHTLHDVLVSDCGTRRTCPRDVWSFRLKCLMLSFIPDYGLERSTYEEPFPELSIFKNKF